MHTLIPAKSGLRPIGTAMLAFVLVAAVVAIWRHNRDILRDLYDYSTVVAAAGKIEAGLKPYTDVRSPMQTSVYYLNWATESVFGKNYLALTWGGLVQALGGGALFVLLLWRRIGLPGAMLLAGAVMLAGLIQHEVFFYNPIGILCFGLVVVGVALEPGLPLRRIETLIVLGALMLGGTNKLNFQALALVIAGLLVLRSWAAGGMKARGAVRCLGLLFLAGVVAPLLFELWWTGASLSTWVEEVVLRPSSRRHLILQWPGLRIFLEPAFDYHHHLLFRPLGGLGLVMMMAITGWVLWDGKRGGARWPDLLARTGLGVIAVVGSVWLMVTNTETVLLTSLAFLLCAFALYLACRGPRAGRDRALAGLLGAAVFWGACGGYAAWHGSRVLYSLNPPPRSEYVRLENAPRALAYFEGVRFPLQMLQSMRELSEHVEKVSHRTGRLNGVLFGPAVEWLERAYPSTIMRGMPIWFHDGTSLHDHDLAWFEARLRDEGTEQIITDVNWEEWPCRFRAELFAQLPAEHRGGRYRIYSAPPVQRAAVVGVD